jgi:glycerol dehydrogenase-like iron-containing ADH family enzyme
MSERRVPARAAEIPSAIVFARSDRDVARALADTLSVIEAQRPLVAFGRNGRALIGSSILIDLGPRLACTPIEISSGSVDEAERLRRLVEESGADVVVGAGGGRTIDVGKLGAFRAGVPFVAVPTQASHDGIVSPVAVLRGPGDDRASSYGARPPAALVVPLHAIISAPRRTLVAGISDLAVNVLAVRDWEWAHQFHDDPYDDYAALLARSAAELMIGLAVRARPSVHRRGRRGAGARPRPVGPGDDDRRLQPALQRPRAPDQPRLRLDRRGRGLPWRAGVGWSGGCGTVVRCRYAGHAGTAGERGRTAAPGSDRDRP